MALIPTASPYLATPRRLPLLWQEVRRKAAALLRSALFHVLGTMLLLTLLASLYIVKRVLGLDMVPGMDMLPDEDIEDALYALANLFGG